MTGPNPKSTSQSDRKREGITRIIVGGFKSIGREQSIEIRPLTILAGANSSGKSSIMQPLLLLKQTLEAPYDPGALLLNGPNVRFTSADQLLSRTNDSGAVDTFHVGIEVGDRASVITYFTRGKNRGFDVEETIYNSEKGYYRLYIGMPQKEFQAAVSAAIEATFVASQRLIIGETQLGGSLESNRCFLVPTIWPEPSEPSEPSERSEDDEYFFELAIQMPGETIVKNYIRRIVHLPGLRGNPERTYPITAVSSEFPGTFENYVASVIGQWQTDSSNEKLEKVNYDLVRLGLTGGIIAKAIDATQIELLVNRFLHGKKSGKEDMVSIADVGFGVSQALPVVVALHVANPGQLLYLEQPEIHLHPRAQSAMAEVLADAAMQGVRLVVETHSSLLLRGVQTLVAEGKLSPEIVKLHWFTVGEDGSTDINSADLDETGAFGDWPEDFDTVTFHSESRYLDAAEARLRGM
jgi:AAA15 family ATPase/GTPase